MVGNLIVSSVWRAPEATALHPVQVSLILTLIPQQRCLTVTRHVSVALKRAYLCQVYVPTLQIGTQEEAPVHLKQRQKWSYANSHVFHPLTRCRGHVPDESQHEGHDLAPRGTNSTEKALCYFWSLAQRVTPAHAIWRRRRQRWRQQKTQPGRCIRLYKRAAFNYIRRQML